MEKSGSGVSKIGGLTEKGCPHFHTHFLAITSFPTCFTCSLIYHSSGTPDDLIMLEEVEQSISIMESYFDQISKLGEVLENELLLVCPDFCSELKEFQDELEEIKNKFDAQTELSTMTHNYYKQDIFKLKEKVDTSSFMKIFSSDLFHHHFDLKFNDNIESDDLEAMKGAIES